MPLIMWRLIGRRVDDMMKHEHAKLAQTKVVDGRQFVYCGCGKRWGGPDADKKRRKHLKKVRDAITYGPVAHVRFSVGGAR